MEISNLQRNVILVYFKDGSHSIRSGSQGHTYFDGDFAMWVQVNNKQMDWGVVLVVNIPQDIMS